MHFVFFCRVTFGMRLRCLEAFFVTVNVVQCRGVLFVFRILLHFFTLMRGLTAGLVSFGLTTSFGTLERSFMLLVSEQSNDKIQKYLIIRATQKSPSLHN